jgi:hypothetical protein
MTCPRCGREMHKRQRNGHAVGWRCYGCERKRRRDGKAPDIPFVERLPPEVRCEYFRSSPTCKGIAEQGDILCANCRRNDRIGGLDHGPRLPSPNDQERCSKSLRRIGERTNELIRKRRLRFLKTYGVQP